jgi:uncharacterized protein (DUF924 family)
LAAARRRWAAELLHHWFYVLRPGDWFRADERVDADLRRRFAPDLAMLRTRPAREFLDDPLTAFAAVLLFDQVPRNIDRGTPGPLPATLSRGKSRAASCGGDGIAACARSSASSSPCP